ncbi:MAG: hypothetical protein R3C68_17610 [Myxococcota bacterium]
MKAEIAYSQYVDQDHLASFDGCLTYGTLGTPARSSPGLRGGLIPQRSAAGPWRPKLSGDIGEYVGVERDSGGMAALHPLHAASNPQAITPGRRCSNRVRQNTALRVTTI